MAKKVYVDETRHELAKYGNYEFPLEIRTDHLAAFENKTISFHWHQYFQFSAVLSGQMEYQIDQVHLHVKAGEGFFINSNHIHGAWQHEDDDCEYVSLLFDPRLIYGFEKSAIDMKYVSPILESKEFGFLYMTPDVEWQKRMIDAIIHMKMLYEKKEPCYELYIKGYLCMMWTELCLNKSSYIKLNAASDEKNTGRLKLMLDYIHRNYADVITLEDVAAAAGLSRSECSRFFKKMVNRTMSEYIASYRVHQSIPMILEGEMTMTDIAQKNGFSGASYFAETFRKCMGISPTEYRDQHEKARLNTQ